MIQINKIRKKKNSNKSYLIIVICIVCIWENFDVFFKKKKNKIIKNTVNRVAINAYTPIL